MRFSSSRRRQVEEKKGKTKEDAPRRLSLSPSSCLSLNPLSLSNFFLSFSTKKKTFNNSKRVLSGVQPTGGLHLGNYLGAIKNWVRLQDEHDAFFCVVDLHAITLPHEPRALLEATRASAALYLAAGVDPSRSAVFAQSHVPAHAELAWLLQCGTPIGWLKRMIQFKEKSAKAGKAAAAAEAEEHSREASGDGASTSSSSSNEESVGAGLLTYPVLMAADILAYRAELVPVGEDQKQHIELARDIADRFNARYGGRNWKKMGGRGGRLFVPPEPMTPRNGARVMSLSDGTAKMSKSAENDASRINLLDSPEVIASKIKRAKTDAVAGFADCVDGSGLAARPEARNLLTIYALVTGLASPEEAARQVAESSWGEFKPKLADAVVEHLRPLQSKYSEVMGDSGELEKIMARGAEDASAVADATLADVRQAMGFVPRPKRI